MTYRVLLPYSGGDDDIDAVEFASRIAADIDARVDTLYVSKTIVPPTGLDQESFDHIRASEGFATANAFLQDFYRKQHKARAAAARQVYEQHIEKSTAKERFAWHEQGDVFQEVAALLQHEAFLHDLTLCSFSLSPPLLDTVIEDVLLATGRPAMFVARRPAITARPTVVVAWKAVPPTVRAMTAALPLLRIAGRCIVVSISEGGPPNGPTASDVASYLTSSGIKAESTELAPDGPSAQAVLDEYCRSVGADTLVMGAYSQSRLKEFVFGGFTRHFLNQRHCNVLMTS